MRLLLTTFPSIGHLYPLVPLGLAARAAGHEVCVATAPDLVPWTITCGLPARPVGPLVRTLVRQVEPAHPERMLTDIWPAAVIGDLLRLAQEWRPDVIVNEEGEYAGVLAAARLGIPSATHSWATPARSPFERAEAISRLRPLWEDQLGPAAGEPRVTGGLYLDACPPPFQLGGLRGVEPVVTVRAVPFDGPVQPAPGWLSTLPRPAAYVTLGADPAVSRPDRLSLLARSVAPAVGAVVVTTGPNDVGSLGELPGWVWARPYLRQSQVLPHVDLVVSQGGAGGLLGALLQARPHLVVPGRNQSQQDVASVTAGIGAGLRLPAEQLEPDRIEAAVRTLLGDVSFEVAASRVRARIELLPGPEEVLELLLALAA